MRNFYGKLKTLLGAPNNLVHNSLKKYDDIIMNSMKESIEIKNTSFYDIMNMDCLWQVGYSGTVNIIIPP